MASNSKQSGRRQSSSAQNGKKRSNAQTRGHASSSGNKKRTSSQSNIKQVQTKGHKQSVKRKKTKYWTIGKKLAMAFSIMILVVVGGVVGVVASKMSLLQTSTLEADKLSIYEDLQYEEKGYLNVALFGVDTRATDTSMGTRSDTIMIVSVNLETKEVRISSVYRDTLLQQSDGTYNKANAAYSYGGAEEAIALLNKNLDLDIQHYVTVDFAALVNVIDAVGGIEIEVTEEEIPYINGYAVEIIQNTGVDTWAVTAPGYQNLTGVQATAYARIRYTAGDDFKRAERQRTVLLKLAEKLQTCDLSTLVNIIDEVFPMVETNFTMTEIIMYAKDIAKFQIGQTDGFPFEKDTMSYGSAGDSVIALTLEYNVIQLHQFLFPDLEYTPSETVMAIDAELGWIHGGDYYSYSSSSREAVEETVEDTYGETETANDYSDFY